MSSNNKSPDSCLKAGEKLLYIWKEDTVLVLNAEDQLVLRRYREYDDRWYNLSTLDRWNNRYKCLILDLLEELNSEESD